MKKYILLIFFSIKILCVGYAQNAPDFVYTHEVTLVFEENFSSSVLDGSKWLKGYQVDPNTSCGQCHCLLPTPPCNRELQYYTCGSNFLLDGSNLNITTYYTPTFGSAKVIDYDNNPNTVEPDGITNYRPFYYTSGYMESKQKFQYGIFEMKAKYPEGYGIWPAFWLFGADANNNSNEIDINEFWGQNPNIMGTNVHCHNSATPNHDDCNLPSSINAGLYLPSGQSLTNSYHTYTLVWTSTELLFYLDGIKVRSVLVSLPVAMSIIENIAIGGCSVSDLSSISPSSFPAQLSIDYIKVWSIGRDLPDCTTSRPDDVYINDDHIHGSQTLHIKNSITNDPSVTIDNDADVWWTTGNYMEFTSNFFVETGAQFTAEALRCTSGGVPSNQLMSYIDNTSPLAHNSKQTIPNKDSTIISPNPNNGKFMLQFQEDIRQITEIKIYDIIGKTVYQSFNNLITQSITFDISSQPKGIYFVKIQSADKVYTEKVVVQ